MKEFIRHWDTKKYSYMRILNIEFGLSLGIRISFNRISLFVVDLGLGLVHITYSIGKFV